MYFFKTIHLRKCFKIMDDSPKKDLRMQSSLKAKIHDKDKYVLSTVWKFKDPLITL